MLFCQLTEVMCRWSFSVLTSVIFLKQIDPALLESELGVCPLPFDVDWHIWNSTCPEGKQFHCFKNKQEEVVHYGCYKVRFCRKGAHPVVDGRLIACLPCRDGFQNIDGLRSNKYMFSTCTTFSDPCNPARGESECRKPSAELDRACSCDRSLGYIPKVKEENCTCFTINDMCSGCKFLGCLEGFKETTAGYCQPIRPITLIPGTTKIISTTPESKTSETVASAAIAIPIVLLLLLVIGVGAAVWKRNYVMKCWNNIRDRCCHSNSSGGGESAAYEVVNLGSSEGECAEISNGIHLPSILNETLQNSSSSSTQRADGTTQTEVKRTEPSNVNVHVGNIGGDLLIAGTITGTTTASPHKAILLSRSGGASSAEEGQSETSSAGAPNQIQEFSADETSLRGCDPPQLDLDAADSFPAGSPIPVEDTEPTTVPQEPVAEQSRDGAESAVTEERPDETEIDDQETEETAVKEPLFPAGTNETESDDHETEETVVKEPLFPAGTNASSAITPTTQMNLQVLNQVTSEAELIDTVYSDQAVGEDTDIHLH